MSSESGTYEVYVRAYPGTASESGTKWRVSNGGGFNFVWSRNGHKLYYRGADSRIRAVDYSINGDVFVAEKPRIWSETPVFASGIMPAFDITPDGKRFAVLEAVQSAGSRDARHRVTLVLNFFQEVARRVAAGGK
jgi:hypothetical protein